EGRLPSAAAYAALRGDRSRWSPGGATRGGHHPPGACSQPRAPLPATGGGDQGRQGGQAWTEALVYLVVTTVPGLRGMLLASERKGSSSRDSPSIHETRAQA